jgi:hypothetical protein
MVERQLPKLHTGVRFPSPALFLDHALGVVRLLCRLKRTSIGESKRRLSGAAAPRGISTRMARSAACGPLTLTTNNSSYLAQFFSRDAKVSNRHAHRLPRIVNVGSESEDRLEFEASDLNEMAILGQLETRRATCVSGRCDRHRYLGRLGKAE